MGWGALLPYQLLPAVTLPTFLNTQTQLTLRLYYAIHFREELRKGSANGPGGILLGGRQRLSFEYEFLSKSRAASQREVTQQKQTHKNTFARTRLQCLSFLSGDQNIHGTMLH